MAACSAAVLVAGPVSAGASDEPATWREPAGLVHTETVRVGTSLMDVYWPAFGTGVHGGMLFIHGGGWGGGSRDLYQARARTLALAGYVAATTDYRLAPGATWPDPLTDVSAALAALRARAGVYHLDVHRIAAAGDSAGGQLAMMLGTVGTGRSRVSAVVSWSGISDMAALFTWPQSVLVAYAAATMMRCAPAQCPDRYRNASPISWVDPSDTPMLLINSANEAVAASQATEMARALTAARLVARTEIVPGTAHGTAIEPQTWSLAMSWAARYLGPPAVGVPRPPPRPRWGRLS